MVAVPGQVSLFGHEEPRCDVGFARMERIDLGEGAWLEIARGWVTGHETLFEVLRDGLAWRSDERKMYDRRVEVPRLLGSLKDQPLPHPAIAAMKQALDARYETDFCRITAALYRDGTDSVAWHGDYVARRMMQDTLVATVSFGSPRRFLVRRKGGGPSTAVSLGWGDLIVMGGSCQRTHEHAIPKVAKAGPRIALMFRPLWEE